MEQLLQSKFTRDGVEYTNISSTEIRGITLTNLAVDAGGNLIHSIDNGDSFEGVTTAQGDTNTNNIIKNIGKINVLDFSYTRSGTVLTGAPTTTLNITDLVENNIYMIDGDWAVSNAWIDSDTIKFTLSDNTNINILTSTNTTGTALVEDISQIQFPYDQNTGQRTIFMAKLIKRNNNWFFALIPSESGQDIVTIDGETLVDYETQIKTFNYNDGQKFLCVSGGNASYKVCHIYNSVYNFTNNTVSFTDLTSQLKDSDFINDKYVSFTTQTLNDTQKTQVLNNLGITVTPIELNYTSGVTSNIQTQINNINTEIGNVESILNTLNSGRGV
jgi:hypothetical protein